VLFLLFYSFHHTINIDTGRRRYAGNARGLPNSQALYLSVSLLSRSKAVYGFIVYLFRDLYPLQLIESCYVAELLLMNPSYLTSISTSFISSAVSRPFSDPESETASLYDTRPPQHLLQTRVLQSLYLFFDIFFLLHHGFIYIFINQPIS